MATQAKKADMKKILIPIVAIVAVIAVILTIVLVSGSSESYRLIKINSFKGGVELQRASKGEVEVFEGLQLISADIVSVGSGAFLELLADSDKHIAAEENTGFKLYSSGNEKSGNISIDLLYGKALFTIENKLSEGSFFQVSSPNATLSVRGTTFSVGYDAEAEKTIAEVTEGKVAVNYEGGETTLQKGDKITVTGMGDNIRAEVERASGDSADDASSSLLTFSMTYPQVNEYAKKDGTHYLSVSKYTAEKSGVSDMSCSDSTADSNSLKKLSNSLKKIIASHSDEVNKFFEENKTAAIKKEKDVAKDITAWMTEKLTAGKETLRIDKAVMDISVASDNVHRSYYTSETYETESRGNTEYYHADGIVIKLYGAVGAKPAATATAAPSDTTKPSASVTTTGDASDSTTTTPVSTEAPSSDDEPAATTAPSAVVTNATTTKASTSSYTALKTFNSDSVNSDAMMNIAVSYEVNSSADGFKLMKIVLEDGGGLSDCMDDADWSGDYANLASVAINGSVKNYESGKTKIKTGEGLGFMKSLMKKLTDTYLSRESEVQSRYLKKYMKDKLKGIQEDDCLYSHSDMYGNGENIYDDVTSWFPKSIKVDTGDSTYKITFKKVGLHAQLTCDAYSADSNPDSPLVFKNRSTGENVMITNVDYYFDYFVNIDKVN